MGCSSPGSGFETLHKCPTFSVLTFRLCLPQIPEFIQICPVIREASPQPKKKPLAPKPKKKAIESDGEESDAYSAKTNGNGVTNGKKAADGGVTSGKKAADDDDDDFMIVSDSDSEGETHGGRYTPNKKGEYIDTARTAVEA